MKTFIKSTLAVAAICLVAGWALRGSAVSPDTCVSTGTTVQPGGVSDGMAAKLTEQTMERLAEISSH